MIVHEVVEVVNLKGVFLLLGITPHPISKGNPHTSALLLYVIEYPHPTSCLSSRWKAKHDQTKKTCCWLQGTKHVLCKLSLEDYLLTSSKNLAYSSQRRSWWKPDSSLDLLLSNADKSWCVHRFCIYSKLDIQHLGLNSPKSCALPIRFDVLLWWPRS